MHTLQMLAATYRSSIWSSGLKDNLGVEDYEYAAMLARLMAVAKERHVDVRRAEAALALYGRQFLTPVTWATGETYWNTVRTALAQALEELSAKTEGG